MLVFLVLQVYKKPLMSWTEWIKETTVFLIRKTVYWIGSCIGAICAIFWKDTLKLQGYIGGLPDTVFGIIFILAIAIVTTAIAVIIRSLWLHRLSKISFEPHFCAHWRIRLEPEYVNGPYCNCCKPPRLLIFKAQNIRLLDEIYECPKTKREHKLFYQGTTRNLDWCLKSLSDGLFDVSGRYFSEDLAELCRKYKVKYTKLAEKDIIKKVLCRNPLKNLPEDVRKNLAEKCATLQQLVNSVYGCYPALRKYLRPRS